MPKIKEDKMCELEKMGFTISTRITDGAIIEYSRTKYIDRGIHRRATYQRTVVFPLTGTIRYFNMHSEVFNKTCWIKDLIKADMVEDL